MKATNRNAIYAKIAIARKQLAHMDEDSYRDLLERETGKRSAKDCTVGQLNRLLHCFEKLGVQFSTSPKKAVKKQQASSRPVKAVGPSWVEIGHSDPLRQEKRQILAIWKKLGYSMQSLETRCKRAFNVSSFTWLHDANQVRTLLNDLQRREKSFDARMLKKGQVSEA